MNEQPWGRRAVILLAVMFWPEGTPGMTRRKYNGKDAFAVIRTNRKVLDGAAEAVPISI